MIIFILIIFGLATIRSMIQFVAEEERKGSRFIVMILYIVAYWGLCEQFLTIKV